MDLDRLPIVFNIPGARSLGNPKIFPDEMNDLIPSLSLYRWLVDTMELVIGEEFEWGLEDKNTLVLRRKNKMRKRKLQQ